MLAQSEFARFIDSLNADEIKEFRPEEMKHMVEEKSSDELKLVLDKIENW